MLKIKTKFNTKKEGCHEKIILPFVCFASRIFRIVR
jgi:hypothetical protein